MVVRGHFYALSVVSSSRYHRVGDVIGFEGNLDILERETLQTLEIEGGFVGPPARSLL